MTTVIVPVNAYAASLSIPADGEGVSAASVALYVQEIANRLEFIRQRTPGTNPVANPIKIVRAGGESIIVAGSTQWGIITSGATNMPYANNTLIGTEPFLIPLDLTAGMTIRNFTAQYLGAGAHAALPAVMPKVELVKFDLTAFVGSAAAPTLTVVDTMVDASGTTAALQLAHNITKAAAGPPLVGANEKWFLRCTGESGANALTGGKFIGGSVDVSA